MFIILYLDETQVKQWKQRRKNTNIIYKLLK